MSTLLTGFLGLALKVVPSLFKVLRADRQDGEVQSAAIAAVKEVLGVTKTQPTEAEIQAAAKKLEESDQAQAKLRERLSALEAEALKEQERALAEQKKIDLAFIELEEEERKQRHQQKMERLDAELKSVQSARDYALEAAGSEKIWVAAINPVLSIIIILGFISTLVFIVLTQDSLQNPEIFYTAIGTLATAFATIIGFHFGSSSGSKQKDEMIIDAVSTEVDVSTPQGSPEETAEAITASVPTDPPENQPRPDPGGTFGLFRVKVPDIASNILGKT